MGGDLTVFLYDSRSGIQTKYILLEGLKAILNETFLDKKVRIQSIVSCTVDK
jgi:hypothetical protein